MAAPAIETWCNRYINNALGGSTVAAIFYPSTEIADAFDCAVFHILTRVSPQYRGYTNYGSGPTSITLTGNGTTKSFDIHSAQNVSQILTVKLNETDAYTKQYLSARIVSNLDTDWADNVEEDVIYVWVDGKYIKTEPAMPTGMTATVDYIAWGGDYTTIENYIPQPYWEAVAMYAIWILKHKDPSNDSTDLNMFWQDYERAFNIAKAATADFGDRMRSFYDDAYSDMWDEL